MFRSIAEAAMARKRTPSLSRVLDALERCLRHVRHGDWEGLRLRTEAERWFASTDASDPLGFERVCASLRLDTARIRLAVARQREERNR
jgi:hypothetical protein